MAYSIEIKNEVIKKIDLESNKIIVNLIKGL